MKICPNCKAENSEGSIFCNKCGNKIQNEDREDVNTIDIHEHNDSNNKTQESSEVLMKEAVLEIDSKIEDSKSKVPNSYRKYLKPKVLVPIAVIIIGIISAVSVHFSNPLVAFKNDIKQNKSMEAMAIYNGKLEANAKDKKDALDYLNNEVSTIKEKFINKEITFDNAKNELSTIATTGLVANVSEVTDYITKMEDSRTAFYEAEKYAKNNDYVHAVKSYSKVIKEDSNYKSATDKIKELSATYKSQVLTEAEVNLQKKDYSKATDILLTASVILLDDNDIKTKLADVNSKLQTEQEVVVLSSSIHIQSTEWKSLYPDMLSCEVKNNTTKTVKNYEVAWVGYDNNGYPLKIKQQYDYGNSSYEKICQAQDANIVPGANYGSDKGWSLDENHGLSKVFSCVKTVTYYDGSTWTNPYYQYWSSKYVGKPL